jgi:predicted DNA-binding protein (MmcQ/YjbR family)
MPDTAEKISRGHIPVLTVKGKNFCVFWRADGRPNVCFNAGRDAQEMLVGADSERYFVPAYMGVRGWVGVRLDGDVDWEAVEELARESHRLSAPVRKRPRA